MFDIRTSHDFYAMLVADFDDYMSDPQSTRRALHCAITAYHLREWVWHDWLKDDQQVQQALGIKDEASFNAWVNQSFPWFPIVRELVNGTKHFEPRHDFETLKVGVVPFAFDQVTAGLDQGSWDKPMPLAAREGKGSGFLLLDYGEGAGEHRWQPAAHLMEGVVRFWRDFFRAYRPMPGLPVSSHHVDSPQPWAQGR